MNDRSKTKEQLTDELLVLRQQIARLEKEKNERKYLDERLARQQKDQQIIFDAVPAMIFFKDTENRFIRVNKALAEASGMTVEQMEGTNCAEIFPAMADNYWHDDKEVMATRVPKRNIIESIPTSKGLLWLKTDKIPYWDEKDNIAGIIGFSIDITTLKNAEAKYYDLYDHAPDMYYSLDLATGAIKECNETLLRRTGYSRDELIGRHIFEMFDSESAKEAERSFQQFSVTGEVRDAERRVKCKDGSIIDVSLNVSAIRDKNGNITHSRSIWHDITERKKQEEIIRALSITDQLTGLYNRRGFMTLGEQQLRVAERTKSGVLILFADLDGLKQINDKLGHKSGDEAINETAQALKEVFRNMDIVARMGGDEFAVLTTETSGEYADIIKNRIQHKLDILNLPTDRQYNLSLSIGVVYHPPPPPNSLDGLLSSADTLMYEQKQRKSLKT